MWNLSTKKAVLSEKGHYTNTEDVAFAADGKTFVTTGWDGRIIHWNLAGKKLKDWQTRGPITCLRLSADGRRLFAGCEYGTVLVFRMPAP